MRYTKAQFDKEYPSDEVCLKAVLDNRYGDTCPQCGVICVKFHPVKGRKVFVCSECDKHISPLADTIFHKSSTTLRTWFYAIYLFSVSKNGVSARELERHLGVTRKTAWRMAIQIKKLMAQDDEKLSGIVESDETYFGGRMPQHKSYENKTGVFGAVEKNGRAKAKTTDLASMKRTKAFLEANVELGSELHTDESRLYIHAKRNYVHKHINHKRKVYSLNGVHTNNIEGFWSQLKRSLDGTHHYVSPKYLQLYVDEFVYRYNHREEAIFPLLVARVEKLA